MTLKTSEIQILAKRYSTALFEALEGKKLDSEKALKQLNEILEISENDENFKKFLKSPVFSKSEKSAAIEGFAKKLKVSDKVKNLLLVLAENNRLAILPSICEAFKVIVMEAGGYVLAEVTSAKKLKPAEVTKINKTIEGATGKKVECDTFVDESIIGGLKIKIGSKLFDNSIKSKLEKLRLKLAS